MPIFYRIMLALVVIAFMTAGCQTSATPTTIPAANTPILPTSTPIPATNTQVSPTNTPIPATPVPPTATMLPTVTAPVFAANAIAFFAFNPGSETSEIKVMQADGSNPQSIPGMSGAATFSWSPDRKRLVYIVHYGDSNWSMYIVGADGKNKVRLTQGDLDYNPIWSPDGEQIAFSRNGNLWVMRVSNDHQPVASDLWQLTTDPKQLVWKIAWSPDGKQIAFDSQMGDPKGTAIYNDPSTTEIYLINADGSNLRQLTDNQFIDAGPSWSPDGKNIVFFSNRDGDPNYTMKKAFSAKNGGAFQIYCMAANGQNVQRLTNTTANDMQPDWSPDGKQIAFSSNRDGNYEIYGMNADGSEPTRLTESPTQDGSPAWLLPVISQPASSTAYLGQIPPGLTPQVFAPGIVSVKGAMDFAAGFSPNGNELYFTRRFDGQENVIYETHLVNGIWTEPAPTAFASGYVAFEPHVTADNQTIYFGWAHSLSSEEKGTLETGGIWATDRTASGWSAPRHVGEGMFVSSDQSGQIYVTSFASGRPGLSKVTLTAGLFTAFEDIGGGVHPAIAPDGSYLVNDNGDGSLRVRFRLADGTWSAPKDLTTQGIPASAAIASISPDGKYLFYTDKGDLYWVSTDVIKSLK